MLAATLIERVALAEPVETIGTMAAAASNRLLDALAVAIERPNEALGCAYLLGYVVECTLKSALGRILHLSEAESLREPVFEAVGRGKGHDLTRLINACLVQREVHLGLLPAEDASLWIARVSSVTEFVKVDFRYKSLAVRAVDLEPLYRDVEWIVAHVDGLRSRNVRKEEPSDA